MKRRTSTALRQLVSLQPKTARVRREGVELDVPVEALAAGDVVVVMPGERIAADGKLLAGATAVDESSVDRNAIAVRIFADRIDAEVTVRAVRIARSI